MKKLKQEERVELEDLFINHGWRVMHLARKYSLHHSTVQGHVEGLERKVPPIDYCPQEIVEVSAQYASWKRNRPRTISSYEEYRRNDEQRKLKKKASCKHTRVAIICLECTEHLEETRSHNAIARVEFI